MTPTFFQHRTVMVTGASRGIGRALALQLAGAGARVLAVGRDRAALEVLALAAPGQILPYPCDLTVPAQISALATAARRDHPDLSILINNAGIMTHTDLTVAAPDRQAEVLAEIATNLSAPLLLITELLPLLARQPQATVCNVTSGIAIAPTADAAVYAATKAGLRHFTRALRYQVEDRGWPITVSECIMTLVATGLSRDGGRKRYPPDRAAADLLAGIARGQREIWVEKARLLRPLMRLSPALTYRLMRGR